jgi:integrase
VSIRKRTWTTPSGEAREAWVVDYYDTQGKRRLKTFKRKKEAEAWAAKAAVDIQNGTHVADSASVSVEAAGKLWRKSAAANGLESTTLDQYRQHCELHINPIIGGKKLSQLNVPAVRAFEDELRQAGRSPAMVRKVLRSLGTLLADAQERGLVGRNAVREMSNRKKTAPEKRHKKKLQAGVDIPLPGEVRAFLAALKGRWRPLLLTAVFTGLRASELRGLRWKDVDFKQRLLHVRHRIDRYGQAGRPKSEAGERAVPLSPVVVNTLREWKLACPRSELGLVFPNGRGKPENLANIVNRGLCPAMVAAGVCDPDGKARYTGMHALRHFYASWLINSVEDGGLGLSAKIVQERMGHANIAITMDTYGHLFPRADNEAELARAERLLLGA